MRINFFGLPGPRAFEWYQICGGFTRSVWLGVFLGLKIDFLLFSVLRGFRWFKVEIDMGCYSDSERA